MLVFPRDFSHIHLFIFVFVLVKVFGLAKEPEIVKGLQNQYSFQEGDSVKLEVQCKGNPKPNIKWFRNGSEIFPKADKVIFESKGDFYFLTLKTVSPIADYGMYTFAARGLKTVVQCSGYIDIDLKGIYSFFILI
jgi:hypothetical protein